MHYDSVVTGAFLARPNRFIAHVDLDGRTVVCHVKNTGRCRELLIPGVKVLLEYHKDAWEKGRKTSYSLIGVWKIRKGRPPLLINMDSQAPNEAAWEWICNQGLKRLAFKEETGQAPGRPFHVTDVRREIAYDQSRFDLAFVLDGQPAFMEVKGVTLEEGGLAMFPDAPTERGVRHLKELIKATREGIPCFILFVIQMKEISCFTPNRRTHPAFADALADAANAGVTILAMDCRVTEDSMEIDAPVPVQYARID